MPARGASSAPSPSRRPVVVIGAIVLAIGAYFLLSALRFVAASVPTTGVIVAQGRATYTVRFEVDGRPVQFESSMPTARGFARSKIQVGRAVEVRYPPDAPAEARVAGSTLWVFPLAMTFIGVVAIAIGFVRSRDDGGAR